MILISHRGNITGKIKERENTKEYILEALGAGYDVEIDLWFQDGSLFLGHDQADHAIDYDFLTEKGLWIHCKNIPALEFLKDKGNPNNYFFHDIDETTLTSKGLFWTYPGKQLTKWSIAVMPEMAPFENLEIAAGVCSDFIEKYK